MKNKRVRNIALVVMLLLLAVTLAGCAMPTGTVDPTHPAGRLGFLEGLVSGLALAPRH